MIKKQMVNSPNSITPPPHHLPVSWKAIREWSANDSNLILISSSIRSHHNCPETKLNLLGQGSPTCGPRPNIGPRPIGHRAMWVNDQYVCVCVCACTAPLLWVLPWALQAYVAPLKQSLWVFAASWAFVVPHMSAGIAMSIVGTRGPTHGSNRYSCKRTRTCVHPHTKPFLLTPLPLLQVAIPERLGNSVLGRYWYVLNHRWLGTSPWLPRRSWNPTPLWTQCQIEIRKQHCRTVSSS